MFLTWKRGKKVKWEKNIFYQKKQQKQDSRDESFPEIVTSQQELTWLRSEVFGLIFFSSDESLSTAAAALSLSPPLTEIKRLLTLPVTESELPSLAEFEFEFEFDFDADEATDVLSFSVEGELPPRHQPDVKTAKPPVNWVDVEWWWFILLSFVVLAQASVLNWTSRTILIDHKNIQLGDLMEMWKIDWGEVEVEVKVGWMRCQIVPRKNK